MICRVMQQSDFRHVVAFRDSGLTFQNWMIEVLEEGNGTFKARSVYKEQQQIVGDIVHEFKISRVDAKEKVCSLT